MENYLLHLLVMLGIYAILVYSLNLVIGFGGLLSVCHAAFYGIGAYAYTLAVVGQPGARVTENLMWSADWPFFAALLFSILVTALIAYGVGWVVLRFRGDFFVFATLGFQMVAFVLLYNWIGLSNGPFGIYGIPRPEIFSFSPGSPGDFFILVLALNGIALPLLFLLYRSPFGLSLKALREDSLAAQSLGVSAHKQFLAAFTLAAGFAAISGALYASYVSYIDPTSFNLKESLFIATVLLLGGGGNLKGPITGAVFMLALPEVLRLFPISSAAAANLREITYGVCLVLVMYFRPYGVFGIPHWDSVGKDRHDNKDDELPRSEKSPKQQKGGEA